LTGIDSVQLPQRSKCYAAFGESYAHLDNVICGQLRAEVLFTALDRFWSHVRSGLLRRQTAPLRNHVIHVVLVGAKKEVSKSRMFDPVDDMDAEIVVPGTVSNITRMQNEHSFWDRPVYVLPGKAVNADVSTVKLRRSISVVLGGPSPKPTGVGNVRLDNFLPNTGFTMSNMATPPTKANAVVPNPCSSGEEIATTPFTNKRNKGRKVIMGGHREVLSHGATPRRSDHRAGSLRSLNYTKKPHIYAGFGGVV
jgi:hypothetical protein